jgi:hypothetical protein
MAACQTTTVVTPTRAYPPTIAEQFLSKSQSHLGVAFVSAASVKNMRWLLRYARHCGVQLDAQQPEANALRSQFTKTAWRLLCRSGRDHFLPILRNRELGFDSLVRYAQALAENGFQVAPSHELLAHLIQSSYYFFDRMPEVPDSGIEIILLRLATRHGTVGRTDFMRVHDWQGHGGGTVTLHMTWASVQRRVTEWHERQRLLVNRAKAGCGTYAPTNWQFFCGSVDWQGYEIVPLVNEVDLWDEAQGMANCLYQLRRLCNEVTAPSRFFSIRKNGRRHATLELVCNRQNGHKRGPNANTVRWRLQDCRLSHNRLPSDALVQTLIGFATHYNNLYRQSKQRQTESSARAHAIPRKEQL